jgi:uncharacterized protein
VSELDITLSALHVHPVKSCAGVALDEALVVETGLEFDRAWMVVDAHGDMLTQRELPRLALVRPTLRHHEMVLRAPGMLPLHVALDTVETATRVRVCDDEVPAYDMGATASQWFSDLLGVPRLRMVRFDPAHKRLSERRWTGGIEAENAFSDGFPLLVMGGPSLAALNRRLADRGAAPVGIERFRPNLVLEGLQEHDEDHLDEISFETPEGPVRLKLVKPCIRCSIPNVDPATGETGSEPGATLAGYRADPRMNGGITFGMNAVILQGIDCTLRAGQRGKAVFAF